MENADFQKIISTRPKEIYFGFFSYYIMLALAFIHAVLFNYANMKLRVITIVLFGVVTLVSYALSRKVYKYGHSVPTYFLYLISASICIYSVVSIYNGQLRLILSILSMMIIISAFVFATYLTSKKVHNWFKTSKLIRSGLEVEEEKLVLTEEEAEFDDNKVVNLDVRPWSRYFARYIDYSTYLLLFVISIFCVAGFLIFLHVNLQILIKFVNSQHITPLIVTVLIFAWFIIFEAILLSFWGTTPGKWLFNITLLNANESKLSFKEGLFRSTRVLVEGMGLQLPIVSMITMIVSYRHLKNDKITTWDSDSNYIVLHRNVGAIKKIWITIILLMVFILALIIKINTHH